MASILIVEDDLGMARLLEKFLASGDHGFRTATDAQTALMMALADPPDVVICDQHLPNSPTGLWLLQQLRDHSVVVGMILLTGDAGIPPKDSLRHGIVAYLVKPVTQLQVVDATSAAIAWVTIERERKKGGGEPL